MVLPVITPKVTFYSIGENCLGHGVLARHGMNVSATPFSHARSNVDYLTKMLSTDFSDILERSALRHEIRNNARVVVNSRYSCTPGIFEASVSNEFEFSHHDVIDKVAARESYERKTARFLEAFSGDGAACFLYHYRLNAGQNIPLVAEKLKNFKEICARRSSRPIAVVMFTQTIVPTDAERGVRFEVVNGIPTATLATRKAWGGTDNDVFWGKTDDDLFARMIGAFDYIASVEPQPEQPKENVLPFLSLARRLFPFVSAERRQRA